MELCIKLLLYEKYLKFRISTYSVNKAARSFMLSSQVQVTNRKMVVEFL